MDPERPSSARVFPRDEGRHAFRSAAAFYGTARPDYPERVYEVLRDRCGLGPSSRVLDIGAGTGLATKRLAATAAAVVAVEPNDALADQLREDVEAAGGLEVIVSPFEEVDLAPSSFDIVTSATAFHWLDPDVAFPKIASALRAGGWLALWWNVSGDPDAPDPFHEATKTVLETLEHGPSFGPGGVDYALDLATRTMDLAEHGFKDVEHEAVRWTLELDAPRTRQLYATYSNIARLPAAQRTGILDEIERIAEVGFGGRVERRMVTPIYTAHV